VIYTASRQGDRDTFADLGLVVRRTTRALRPHLDKFDAIAVTGVSGDSVGFPTALRLGVPIVSVRKSENHHQYTGSGVAGWQGLSRGSRILFLDDFVSSGETRKRVEAGLKGLKLGHRIVGQYLYHEGGDYQRRMGELTWLGPDGWPKGRYL
jgi:adenine/guanine phosphoribosyltransferase-like PRPP-binding protein